MKPIQAVQADPSNAILFIIDVEKEPSWGGPTLPAQPAVLQPAGSRRATAASIVPTIRGLIDRCHAAGVRVIYIQSVRNHTEHQFTVYSTMPRHLKIGTPASEFFDEIRPNGMDIVVRKWDHDPWFETDLERVLAGVVPDPTRCQALITGGSINGCAFHAMLGFHARNYRVAMIMDAVYGSADAAAAYFSRPQYPTYPNITLTTAELITFSAGTAPERAVPQAARSSAASTAG